MADSNALHGDCSTELGPEDDGARCFCGHYQSEHDSQDNGRCGGAYATLQADPDDFESVEVCCPCDRFAAVEPGWHEVRSR